jgi:hypothetical protein
MFIDLCPETVMSWSCQACTFENSQKDLLCNICSLPCGKSPNKDTPKPGDILIGPYTLSTQGPPPKQTEPKTEPKVGQKSVYLLELKHGKFYVGITSNIVDRFWEHKTFCGSEWTATHQPIRILMSKPCSSQHSEDNETLEQMARYGIDNVRGGSFCSVDLSQDRSTLEKMIAHRFNLCFYCHMSGHLAHACSMRPKVVPCGRCGFDNHSVKNCFAKRTKDGRSL